MKAIHHTGIIVSDLERSIGFYHEVLGLAFAAEPTAVIDDPELGPKVGVPGAKLRLVTFVVGDGLLELLQFVAPPSPIDAPLPQNALGAHHVALLVDDIAAEVERLTTAGVEFLSDVTAVDEGVLAGWRWVYFRDPDGILLELVEVAYSRPEERRSNIERYQADRATLRQRVAEGL
jgi:catechol 2,3-dioxygenase-like lactoylglutathione lyase family enzyme